MFTSALTHPFIRQFSLLTGAIATVFLGASGTIASNPPNLPDSTPVYVAQNAAPLKDGVYLYGQSPQPEQLGQEYLVFKVNQGRIVGAFYMPQSEFNCFYGTINSRKIALSIVDPSDHQVYPYEIAFENVSTVASREDTSINVRLEGYYPIDKISENDHRLLNTCLREHS